MAEKDSNWLKNKKKKKKRMTKLCNLKKLFFAYTSLFFFCWSATAKENYYTYTTLYTNSGAVLSGQTISEYEQRWFWEPVQTAKHFTSLFYFEHMKPKILFVSKQQVLSTYTSQSTYSLYHEFLKNNGLLLKRPPLKNWNFISTGNDGHHLFENMFGNFAWDILKIKDGKMFKGEGLENKDHHVWAAPIYSPIKGTVIELERGVEDNRPDPTHTSDLSTKGDGNFVLIHISDAFYFSLLHFKKDSIPTRLKAGSIINAGDYLGDVGNSGISYAPHLHMTMFYWSLELNRMISVPTLFESAVVKSSIASESKLRELFSPQTGQMIKSARPQ